MTLAAGRSKEVSRREDDVSFPRVCCASVDDPGVDDMQPDVVHVWTTTDDRPDDPATKPVCAGSIPNEQIVTGAGSISLPYA